jgi:hypothetical protein
MSEIKRRRLQELPVTCCPGTKVGGYVPFYFCPRSIMLYILHRGNHPELTYRGGQKPIIHLEMDLRQTVKLCEQYGNPWAFTKVNAGTRYADFYKTVEQLAEVNWDAVRATDFREPKIKESKQAEFLVYNSVPWELVETIGVKDDEVKRRVEEALEDVEHSPRVVVKPEWYF